ncbi:MAG TPA: non-heme iron oxygenase ferredoxin subunit [Steroidobacteraceae bacterium]|nr:non-heme iron oxygenase ferredoxin subunit [Steroidobacteraceae bacterium]
MSAWNVVAEAADLAEGEMLAISLGERRLILYRTATGVFATDRRCTHQGADLMRGYLDGVVIECPVHQGRFDIRSGAALNAPVCVPLCTYETRLSEGKIEIKTA